jgi:hypothetical protein
MISGGPLKARRRTDDQEPETAPAAEPAADSTKVTPARADAVAKDPHAATMVATPPPPPQQSAGPFPADMPHFPGQPPVTGPADEPRLELKTDETAANADEPRLELKTDTDAPGAEVHHDVLDSELHTGPGKDAAAAHGAEPPRDDAPVQQQPPQVAAAPMTSPAATAAPAPLQAPEPPRAAQAARLSPPRVPVVTPPPLANDPDRRRIPIHKDGPPVRADRDGQRVPQPLRPRMSSAPVIDHEPEPRSEPEPAPQTGTFVPLRPPKDPGKSARRRRIATLATAFATLSAIVIIAAVFITKRSTDPSPVTSSSGGATCVNPTAKQVKAAWGQDMLSVSMAAATDYMAAHGTDLQISCKKDVGGKANVLPDGKIDISRCCVTQ